MDTVNETKTRRPRRSKADIEEAIMRAAVAQIKKKGFSMALVTDIVKRARIEPIVFYNRYKNLDEFYDSFVKRYDYWISDLVHDIVESITTENGYEEALNKLLNNLLSDNIMTELLRWEIAEGTHITERTARLREIDSQALINKYNERIEKSDIDIVGITALIVAGIYYLVLHKDRSTFAGIDLNRPEGRERLKTALRQTASMLFRYEQESAAGSVSCSRSALEEAMRSEGLSDEAIARCLGKACS